MNEESELSPRQRSAQARARISQYYDQLERRNHFQIFGVDQDTDTDSIKAAYHSLAKRWHADAYSEFDLGPEKEKLDSIFKQISNAYETLADPKRREEYVVLLKRKQAGKVTDVNAIFQAESLVDEAMALIRKRAWLEAEEKLKDAIELNPDDPLYRATLAWCKFHLNKRNKEKVHEAIEMLKTAVKEQESLAVGYLYLGNIHFATEDHETARKWFRKCLEWDNGNIEAQRNIRLITQRAEKKKKSGIAAFFNKLLGK